MLESVEDLSFRYSNNGDYDDDYDGSDGDDNDNNDGDDDGVGQIESVKDIPTFFPNQSTQWRFHTFMKDDIVKQILNITNTYFEVIISNEL